MENSQSISWEFWATVIAVVGIFVSIVIYLLQRNIKRLAYQILTETSLVSVGRKVRGKIKVFYDNKEIETLYLVVLDISNNGNLEIRTIDFEEQPITINFPNSNLVSVEVSNASPKSLKPIISYEPTQVTIQPLLLNKKDSFTLELIFSEYGRITEFHARIAGVKDVEKISLEKRVIESERRNNTLRRVFLFIVLIMSLWALRIIYFP